METLKITELDLLLLRLMEKHFVQRSPETGSIWVRVCQQEYDVTKPYFDNDFLALGYHCIHTEEDNNTDMEFVYEAI